MVNLLLFLRQVKIRINDVNRNINKLFILKRLEIHTKDNNINSPRKYFKLFIHCPGLGRSLTIFGIIIKHKYGNEKPNAMLKNIITIFWFDDPIEKPTAVPKKGALQGVAKRVANTPEK